MGDLGNVKGFGFIYKKIPKFQCGRRIVDQSVSNSNEASRNLNKKPELSSNIMTGVFGDNSHGGLVVEHLTGLERESGIILDAGGDYNSS